MIGSDIVYHPGPYAAVNQDQAVDQDKSSAKTLLRGFLKQETVQMLWSPVVLYESNSSSDKKKKKNSGPSDEMHYGMGWACMPFSKRYAFCKDQRYFVSHTGGAMGASSVLLILPRASKPEPSNNTSKHDDNGNVVNSSKSSQVPEGVVVSIICNTSNVGLTKLALDIAKTFEMLRPAVEGPYRVQKVYQC